MSVYSIKTIQKLPVSLKDAWSFFSHPKNLAEMTPEYLNLRFTNTLYGEEMYSGQVMTYKVKPLFGIPLFWMTEITHVEDKKYFVDEQRVGPYNLWHHQHHFSEVEGGVLMTDEVNYGIPLGFIGRLAHWLFVGREVNAIFEHRFKVLEKYFQPSGKTGV